MSKPTNATPDTTLPGGDTGPLLWYDQPSTAIEDLDMKDNATPGFWKWLGFWLSVPVYWLTREEGYWTRRWDGGARGYLSFSDFRKDMLDE